MNSNTTSSLAPGTILHGEVYNYKITKVLGQGSYGITYLAETVNSNEATCLVAIKELFIREACTRTGTTVNTGNAGTDFAYFKQKFEKEALHIKTLNHPNIVRSAETFKANNTVYFVMEFINGESLSNRIARLGRLSESEALNITRQIGAALRHMHAHNMLHLDVKPDNIMMRGNEAVLVDFGLSKQYDRNGKAMTMTLITSGTNGYAPMEQFSYREHNGFPATLDIHALGATLFKMLTGYGNMQDLVFEIDEEGFPSQKLLAFNVSAHIVAVIEKAMAHLARNRYQSIDEMLKALDTQTTQNHQSNEATTFASSNNSFSYKKEMDEEEEIEEEGDKEEFFPPALKDNDMVIFRFREGEIEYNFEITIRREGKDNMSIIRGTASRRRINSLADRKFAGPIYAKINTDNILSKILCYGGMLLDIEWDGIEELDFHCGNYGIKISISKYKNGRQIGYKSYCKEPEEASIDVRALMKNEEISNCYKALKEKMEAQ